MVAFGWRANEKWSEKHLKNRLNRSKYFTVVTSTPFNVRKYFFFFKILIFQNFDFA